MFTGLGTAMILNAANIVIVRMQNVDYRNRKSLLNSIADLVRIDKHRMFYRGLMPISLGCFYLSNTCHGMQMFRRDDSLASNYIWPFVFLVGAAIAHPFYLLGMRV